MDKVLQDIMMQRIQNAAEKQARRQARGPGSTPAGRNRAGMSPGSGWAHRSPGASASPGSSPAPIRPGFSPGPGMPRLPKPVMTTPARPYSTTDSGTTPPSVRPTLAPDVGLTTPLQPSATETGNTPITTPQIGNSHPGSVPSISAMASMMSHVGPAMSSAMSDMLGGEAVPPPPTEGGAT